MPDEEKLLIARFLRANDYSQTLSSFLAEAGLPEDFGSTAAKDDLTLEKLLQEKRAYDLAANFEKLGTDETVAWRVPGGCHPGRPSSRSRSLTTSSSQRPCAGQVTEPSEHFGLGSAVGTIRKWASSVTITV